MDKDVIFPLQEEGRLLHHGALQAIGLDLLGRLHPRLQPGRIPEQRGFGFALAEGGAEAVQVRLEAVAPADLHGQVGVRADGVVEERLALRDGEGRVEGGGAEAGDRWGDGLDPVDAAAAEVGHRDGFPGGRVVAVIETKRQLEDDLVGRLGGEFVVAEVG